MSKITEYQNLLNKIFNISSSAWTKSVCVYLVEDGALEFRLDAPNDELIEIDVKVIEDPVFMQCVHIWMNKGEDRKRNGLSYRFFRITGTDEEIQAKLMYMKMVM
jgi:hypothetical protein